MWVNNQTWCSGHVKSFTVVTKRPYHPGACNICLIKAYFGLISNGENAKIKTKQQLLIYKFELNWKVPALQIITLKFFKLTKKIRAPRYLIATSLIINSSSIFSTLIFRLAILLMEKLLSEHTDISVTTHLGLQDLCSESLANRYEINK